MERISVGKCYAQTASDRFGKAAEAIRHRELAALGLEHLPTIWPNLSADNDAAPSMYEIVPVMQQFRNNLTALSQVYNLYFVAYQGRIFVYRPCSASTQAIPCRPDLQLAPRPSPAARHIGGAVDPSRPHLVNHLITGILGEEEIILAGYDDGDVVAYYVKDVEARIARGHGKQTSLLPEIPMKEFLHENVGKSAWGLAVHKKSRLIAVSSNRHEVTVFALGLAKKRACNKKSPVKSLSQGHNPGAYHAEVLGRNRNWRIIVQFGNKCDNIPNICFVDDEKGVADKICAIDINGAAWLANIWKLFQPPIYIAPYPRLLSEESHPGLSRGWCVFALPESSFMTVERQEDLFGIPVGELRLSPPTTCGQAMVDTSASIIQIKENPCYVASRHTFGTYSFGHEPLETLPVMNFNMFLANDDLGDEAWFNGSSDDDEDADADEEDDEHDEFEFDIDIEDDEDEEFELELESELQVNSEDVYKQEDCDGDEDDGAIEAYNTVLGVNDTLGDLPYDMVYWPYTGTVQRLPRNNARLQRFLDRPVSYTSTSHAITGHDHESFELFGDRFHLLRTYEKDFELRTFEKSFESRRFLDTFTVPREAGVLCRDALNTGPCRIPGIRRHFRYTSRLNMIAHMPELSAIAIGSPTGRVLLITLTRLSSTMEHAEAMLNCGLRVERILPTQQHEQAHRKQFRPLYGMAVGPVRQEDGGIGGKAELPRRYRLMLHYQSHDILSYEITREGQTGKLCIF